MEFLEKCNCPKEKMLCIKKIRITLFDLISMGENNFHDPNLLNYYKYSKLIELDTIHS